jgi:hypothetical protein
MNNIFYICQTLVEDGRMDEKTFQKRVIKSLNEILDEVSKLSLCFHPRSNKNIYSDLLSNSNVIEDEFSLNYLNSDNIFLGHYSTIIFNLISKSEKVLLINLDWDPIPDFIYESSSLNLNWSDLRKREKNLDLSIISNSQPNKKLKAMFRNPNIDKSKNKKLFELIF